jgi:transglutaminase-like putative cysteine protease
VSDSIPWASAREYSTIPEIAEYCLRNHHGDCGIQTMLFMTLCRLNGIPARWQSGWMMHPGSVDMHDWCEICLVGSHWIPVDPSFGLQKRQRTEQGKWFYFGGLDGYRLIINNDISAPFSPAKQFFRSETVDFQRGEVEWRGGNLYFDKWNWNMDVKYGG